MKIQTMPVSALVPDAANARAHDARNLDAIKASLVAFGQQKPIVIDRANRVIAGNGTLAAAIALGWETLACVRTDLGEGEARAFGVADNRTAELSAWDTSALAAVLEDIPQTLLDAVGFDAQELDTILGKPPEFKPNLTPRIAAETVRESDFPEASALVPSPERDRSRTLPACCPECGHEFEVTGGF